MGTKQIINEIRNEIRKIVIMITGIMNDGANTNTNCAIGIVVVVVATIYNR